ncbi:MAG: glycosyltransferase family 4 protein [Anaerolineae bacterium]
MLTGIRELHQFLVGATPGDAITDSALLLRSWLRGLGYDSHIYAESIHESLASEIRPYLGYSPRSPAATVLLHHSIGADLVDYLLEAGVRFILIYHNVTPVTFFEHVDPRLAHQVKRGRKQLDALRAKTLLALGDSQYNELELVSVGYENTGVLPIVFDESRYAYESDPELQKKYESGGPNLLFVGRIAPNKCQDDLVKLMYYVRRVCPRARLFLVGSRWMPAYADWLEELAADVGVNDAVVITGHVTQRALATYYRLADVYVSMSEHEGFGKPFIEAMYFGVPIVAYAAAAVPETLGQAGLLLSVKRYEELAELIGILEVRRDLRDRLIRSGRRRVKAFQPSVVRSRLLSYLRRLDLGD